MKSNTRKFLPIIFIGGAVVLFLLLRKRSTIEPTITQSYNKNTGAVVLKQTCPAGYGLHNGKCVLIGTVINKGENGKPPKWIVK